jgi:hypothetical protein
MQEGIVRVPLFVLLFAAQPALAQQLAFPGADGAGRHSLGGRGGKVYEVVNLNDSGAGSLRAAVEATGARIVVFRVSGNIALKSKLSIKNPNITIAGQSAPGDGICLKDHNLIIRADHVVVRYIRVRPGDNANVELDAITVTEGENIIVDHCSTSWAVDETLSVTGDNLDKVTIQWSIISESLNCSVHSKGCHGYGSLVRGSQGHQFSFHHNLYAHHKARLPRPGNYLPKAQDPKGLYFDFRNNVVYDWGGSYAGYNSDSDSVTRMNFVGNYFVSGPSSSKAAAFGESCTKSLAHFAGNYMNGKKPSDPWSLVVFSSGFSSAQIAAYKQSSPIAMAPVSTEDGAVAYPKVLNTAGASFPARDAVDKRIVTQIKQKTGKLIDDESDVGGWPALSSGTPPKDSDHDGMPDAWETARGLDPKSAADGPKDRDGDGYTNIEEYLNCLVTSCPTGAPDAGPGDSGPVDSGTKDLPTGADGPPPSSDGPQPSTDGPQPSTDGPQPSTDGFSADGPAPGSDRGPSGTDAGATLRVEDGCGCRLTDRPDTTPTPLGLLLFGAALMLSLPLLRRRAR